ncbi:hypothetical protein BDZ97DRAFT_1921933 [Flammula alnicola]|nr:hypothetical protein BDZ97DRAFT_1921933 [Flammula alnicola]
MHPRQLGEKAAAGDLLLLLLLVVISRGAAAVATAAPSRLLRPHRRRTPAALWYRSGIETAAAATAAPRRHCVNAPAIVSASSLHPRQLSEEAEAGDLDLLLLLLVVISREQQLLLLLLITCYVRVVVTHPRRRGIIVALSSHLQRRSIDAPAVASVIAPAVASVVAPVVASIVAPAIASTAQQQWRHGIDVAAPAAAPALTAARGIDAPASSSHRCHCICRCVIITVPAVAPAVSWHCHCCTHPRHHGNDAPIIDALTAGTRDGVASLTARRWWWLSVECHRGSEGCPSRAIFGGATCSEREEIKSTCES